MRLEVFFSGKHTMYRQDLVVIFLFDESLLVTLNSQK